MVRLLVLVIVICFLISVVQLKDKKKKKKKGKGKGKKKKKDKPDVEILCPRYEDNLEKCLTKDYNPRWLKCAARNFRIANEGLERQLQANSVIFAEPDDMGLSPRNPVLISNQIILQANEGSNSGRRRGRGRRSLNSKLSDKEVKGCRQTERKIQKTCKDFNNQYSCSMLNEAVSMRRMNLMTALGTIPGGVLPGDLTNENSIHAIKRVLAEFKRRAYSVTKNIKKNETVLVGDLITITEQIVAGVKYNITLELGITDDPVCRKRAINGVVGIKHCDDRDSLGVVHLAVVHQRWMHDVSPDDEWRWFAYYTQPGEGPDPELYWGMDEDTTLKPGLDYDVEPDGGDDPEIIEPEYDPDPDYFYVPDNAPPPPWLTDGSGDGNENPPVMIMGPGDGNENPPLMMMGPGGGNENPPLMMMGPGGGDGIPPLGLMGPGGGNENPPLMMMGPGGGNENPPLMMMGPGGGDDIPPLGLMGPGGGDEIPPLGMMMGPEDDGSSPLLMEDQPFNLGFIG